MKLQSYTYNIIRLLLLLLVTLVRLPLWGEDGEQAVVIGRVVDKHDQLPLASVNVYFKNTDTGTSTNEEGYFMLRAAGEGKRLVFSSVGYKTEEVKLKPGQSAFVTMEMEERNTMLDELFVLPGTNPALEWMKRIRLARKGNDTANDPAYEAQGTEQSLVLLCRTDDPAARRRLFRQLEAGDLTPDNDTTLAVPLYMAETRYTLTAAGKTGIERNTFSTPRETDLMAARLLQAADPELDFYRNAVNVFGKSIVSPLANVGNAYYDYYLADSIDAPAGKQYEMHFRTKNPKNLAFDGMFRFDSASLALTHMEAELPKKANFNHVRRLAVAQDFAPLPQGGWVLENNSLAVAMAYDIMQDTLPLRSELLMRQTTAFIPAETPADTVSTDGFARSGYDAADLDARLQAMDNTPLMRTAKWIADAALTSYARAGWVDFGRLQNVLRLTRQEGLRLAIPLRTNERLWKNISLGGQVGYGFREKKVKFAAFGQFRLPVERRHLFELRYTDDNRRVDYNYNAFLRREDPWDQCDEDIITTIFSFISGQQTSPRREWQLSYATDWTPDIESAVYLRANEFFANDVMPMSMGGGAMPVASFRQQSLTISTRFSFGEKTYDDHLQRLYLATRKPVVYATAEAGRYSVAGKEGFYGKLTGTVKHSLSFPAGNWNYAVEAGCVLGRVPYPLLDYSAGNEPSGIAFHQFNRMRYMEFGHDRYVHTMQEFVFNGLLFNHIPLVKRLNLREMVSVKAVWGGLSGRHREVLDFPSLPGRLRPMAVPYVEGSIGITNFLSIFTFQFNYRFTNNYGDASPGRFSFGLRMGF